MTIQQMHHVGIVVDDLAAAIEFFARLGLELDGQMSLEDPVVDRIVALEGVRTDVAFMQTPDGHSRLELIRFRSPAHEGDRSDPPANAPGIRHLAFEVDDVDAAVAGVRELGAELVGGLEQYEDSFRLCYIRGPAGIIVELAQRLG